MIVDPAKMNAYSQCASINIAPTEEPKILPIRPNINEMHTAIALEMYRKMEMSKKDR